MHNGIRTLSFTGRGKHSISIAIAAPVSAYIGDMKNAPAKNAKHTPAKEPPIVLFLLNGKGLGGMRLPKMDAELSPKAKIAMAALLIGGWKSSSVSKMPVAKYSGAAVNS